MSRRYHPLVQLALLKVRELLREPEALFWIFAFPLLLAVVLAVAFRDRPPERVVVGVEAVETAGEAAARVEEALAAGGLEVRRLAPRAAAAELAAGKVAIVVVPGERWVYRYDPTRPESRLARLVVDDALQRSAGRTDPYPTAVVEVRERGARYIDFLLPGLLGMNLLGTGVWAVGFYIVSIRVKRLLKRMVASPMRRWQFLAGQIGGRMVFLIPEVGLLLLFGNLVLDVPIRGSFGTLALVTVVGALTFSGLGLLIASRTRTIEGASGLMNVVLMPLWVCSGIFFSTSRFPDAAQPLIQVLPVTAVIDALRAVMIDGATLGAVAGEVALTALWGLAFFAAALALFRWE